MIGWTPSWYHPLQRALEPSAPFMIAIALALVLVGVWFVATRNWPMMAAYLTYLLMP
jgi:hypothetical membrane protein